MPTFEDPAADADEARDALRGLARATRSMDDPRQIYSVLGSLTVAVASLGQSLQQLASFHHGDAKPSTWVPDDSGAGSAAAFEVSWELNRAADILQESLVSIVSAHSAEAQITYAHRDFPACADAPGRAVDRGLSL